MKDIYMQLNHLPDQTGDAGGQGQDNQRVASGSGNENQPPVCKAVYRKPVLRCLGALISVAGSDPHW